MDGSPWSFNNHIVLLTRWRPQVSPSELEFEEIDCWTCIHNLPLENYKESIGKNFASKIGTFKSYNSKEELEGKYMRMKIRLNLKEPLRPNLILEWNKMTDLNLPISYEKLPILCYYYGRLGHEISECKSHYEDKRKGLPVEAIQKRRGFGGHMKAEIIYKSQKNYQDLPPKLPHQIIGEGPNQQVTPKNQIKRKTGNIDEGNELTQGSNRLSRTGSKHPQH